MNQRTHTQPETWKPIPNYEGLYEVSNYGRVRACAREIKYKNKRGTEIIRFCKGRDVVARLRSNGYLYVDLWKRNEGKQVAVHSLVLEAFVGARPEGYVCCHEDDVKTNNYVGNLRWGTHSDNAADRVKNGGDKNSNKKYCRRGHPLVAPNLVPSKLRVGSRECLSCNRARNYVNHHKELKPRFKEFADAYFLSTMGETARGDGGFGSTGQ